VSRAVSARRTAERAAFYLFRELVPSLFFAAAARALPSS
jgi:hypothetical protein